MTKTLITGAAGFIGFHLAKRLLEKGYNIVGIDSLNNYYNVNLKKARLEQLNDQSRFEFVKLNMADQDAMEDLFSKHTFEKAVNLAAQPGVRYSLKNPQAYVESNLMGFVNILEGCRYSKVGHLVFASSSSIYGANTKMPYSVNDNVDHPVSVYAATKKSNELLAHSYAHLYNIPCTGLRFFTVYGPWGRPDMAYFLFAKAILEDKPIKVFNHGKMKRDFTYIDDIVEGVIRVLENPAVSNPDWSGDHPDSATSYAPYKLYNIGNNQPVELMGFIEELENALGKKAIKEMLPMQAGDVQATFADIDQLVDDVGFKPETSIKTGIKRFVDWYLEYYQSA